MPEQPNILCFITDQQRADHLGCYGNPDVKTPNIDRLASEGIQFNESFVANPLCMPNRASLFSGMYPKAHGVRENGIGLHPSIEVLPELLRQAGYQTMSSGKLHLIPFGIDPEIPYDDWEKFETPEYWDTHDSLPLPYYGFEEVYYVGGHGPYTFGEYKQDIGSEKHKLLGIDAALETPSGAKQSWKSAISEADHYNTRIADKTIEFLYERDTERPFFAWCSFPDPHHPYMPPEPYAHQYDPDTIQFDPARRDHELDDLPPYVREAHLNELQLGGLHGGSQITDNEYQEIVAHTYGMISMVDHNVGRVMEALESLNELDNTIVIFMSDHGDLMGDHWLINKGPFPFRGLYRVPTIWRLPAHLNANSSTNTMISAVDFAPTLLDFANAHIPDSMQGQSYRPTLEDESVTHRDTAYIEYDSTYLNDRLRNLRTLDWSITHYANSDYGLLYDLKNDPNELHNLWDSVGYQMIKNKLLIQLLQVSTQNDSWLPQKKSHA